MTKELIEQEIANIDEQLKKYSNIIATINSLKKKKTKLQKELNMFKPLSTSDGLIISLTDVEDEEIDVLITNAIKKYISDNINDIFYGEDLDDSDVIYTTHMLVGNRMFEVDINYETEWFSDWSMRKHLIDSYSGELKQKKEILTFTITNTENEVGEIFNATYPRQ